MDSKLPVPTQHSDSLDPVEAFLMRVRYREGKLFDASGNRHFFLDDPEMLWVVYAGHIDVMSVEIRDQHAISTRTHIFRAGTNQFLFGIQPHQGRGLIAIGSNGAKVVSISRSKMIELAADPDLMTVLLEGVAGWIVNLSAAVADAFPPKDFIRLTPGKMVELKAGDVARSLDDITWVQHQHGRSQFMGRTNLPLPGDYVPITDRTWLTAAEPVTLACSDTAFLLENDLFWQQLSNFHQLVQTIIAQRIQHNIAADREHLQNRIQSDQIQHETALRQLALPLAGKASSPLPAVDRTNTLVAACQLVGASAGIKIVAPKRRPKISENLLREIAQASQIRIRQVALSGDWWHLEAGPLLGYWQENMQPVALLPVGRAGYEVVDPETEARSRITPEVAAKLDPFAWHLYRPFPAQRLNGWQLVYFGMRGSKGDLALMIGVGLLGGLFLAVIPLATGYIFDHVIPASDRSQMLQVGILLLFSSVSIMLLQITQGIASLRIQTRFDHSVQPAMWDRLLNLSTTFFRDYTAGDLAQRVIALEQLKAIISGAGASIVISGLSLIFSIILLFIFDWQLAWVAIGIVTAVLIVIIGAGSLQLRLQRQLNTLRGRLSGTMFQLISGISKFRVASAEERAFALWARLFSDVRQVMMRSGLLNAGIVVFNGVIPVVATLILFASLPITFGNTVGLTTGQFLAFYAAFGQFLATSITLGFTFISLSSAFTLYERVKPIIESVPELDPGKADPGELSGTIDVSHVSFRYTPTGPLVLNDVSFSIRRGEFVALVGGSGSGKSTLLRILLGFEIPQAGVVQYDGQDLSELDIRAVRRQLGVVLQTSQLLSGSIFDNIVGQTGLGQKEAMEAARMAGLEADLAQMPMGMQTIVDAGGSTFSGGQRQRLMIARAIVTKPRILYFDEATSALDNRTQEIVSKSLESLDATRIVIAHRLSTIINADRIFVLDRGKLVQTGTYQELLNQPGLFADLAGRQLA